MAHFKPYHNYSNQGGTQIRTEGGEFAILCLTTWPCRRYVVNQNLTT